MWECAPLPIKSKMFWRCLNFPSHSGTFLIYGWFAHRSIWITSSPSTYSPPPTVILPRSIFRLEARFKTDAEGIMTFSSKICSTWWLGGRVTSSNPAPVIIYFCLVCCPNYSKFLNFSQGWFLPLLPPSHSTKVKLCRDSSNITYSLRLLSPNLSIYVCTNPSTQFPPPPLSRVHHLSE